MPSTPSAWESGGASGSTLRTPVPSESAYSCQPNAPVANSPTAYCGCRDATISPTAPPVMTSPSSTYVA
jgi:hypothetical protein